MTPAQFLRDARAAHAARVQYQRAADHLGEVAMRLLTIHDPRAAEVAGYANVAQRAARAEYDNHADRAWNRGDR